MILQLVCPALVVTFGGMWRWSASWRTVARCAPYRTQWGRGVTWRESPAGAWAARTAGYLTVLFSQKILAVRRGNCIYRPVGLSYFNKSLNHLL